VPLSSSSCPAFGFPLSLYRTQSNTAIFSHLPVLIFLMSSISSFITENIVRLAVLGWDVSLTVINLLTPSRPIGCAIPEGSPGARGKWPEFIVPRKSDSRSACPALNAMANHGTGCIDFSCVKILTCYQEFFHEMDETSLSRNLIEPAEPHIISRQPSASPYLILVRRC
jgi:hypothetical protein